MAQNVPALWYLMFSILISAKDAYDVKDIRCFIPIRLSVSQVHDPRRGQVHIPWLGLVHIPWLGQVHIPWLG